MNLKTKRQCARLYINVSKKIVKRQYIQKARHFPKPRQFALRFYSQKAQHFTLRDFHENFEVGIYIYTKSMTLCVTRRF